MPDDVFYIDGDPHYVGDLERCGCDHLGNGRTCERCGGDLHCQPVHDDIIYRCEDCGEDG